ncbi:hypothetical protein [Undibacterium umbellatum]|uniref:Uncharacterized protein n=1 Tax=Undibacterium umbellatum TaxID=2762300 RepID=A0ABR6ZG91_9BURK|nr:hypothetical protein [Undibacterium umbellatum]MBC3910740.1 hypothetical protein [Undibacterium umbellatum]
MSLTNITKKYENETENSVLPAWKKEFFQTLTKNQTVKTVFLRLETQYIQKKQAHHRLVPTIAWKVELPCFQSNSPAQLAELRRELSATLKVNGVHVVHKTDEWMRHLKTHHEVGASYARLCGVA